MISTILAGRSNKKHPGGLRGQRTDLNGEAEILKTGDEAFGLDRLGAAVEVIRAEVLIASPVLEHVICGGQYRCGNGADGFLGAAPRAQAMELGLEIGSLLSRRRPGALDQGGLEPGRSLSHAIGSPLAGAFIGARA